MSLEWRNHINLSVRMRVLFLLARFAILAFEGRFCMLKKDFSSSVSLYEDLVESGCSVVYANYC